MAAKNKSVALLRAVMKTFRSTVVNCRGTGLLDHRGLRAHRAPLAIPILVNIHPYPFTAGVFSLVRALFRVAALDHYHRSDHFGVHRPKLERLKFRRTILDVLEKLLLR